MTTQGKLSEKAVQFQEIHWAITKAQTMDELRDCCARVKEYHRTFSVRYIPLLITKIPLYDKAVSDYTRQLEEALMDRCKDLDYGKECG